MFPFRGNINGTVNSSIFNLPMLIDNFAIVNKTGGAVTVNVYLIGSTTINLSPLSKSIAAGESYENERQTVMLAGETIRVQSGGSVDYDFKISNLQAPTIEGEQQ